MNRPRVMVTLAMVSVILVPGAVACSVTSPPPFEATVETTDVNEAPVLVQEPAITAADTEAVLEMALNKPLRQWRYYADVYYLLFSGQIVAYDSTLANILWRQEIRYDSFMDIQVNGRFVFFNRPEGGLTVFDRFTGVRMHQFEYRVAKVEINAGNASALAGDDTGILILEFDEQGGYVERRCPPIPSSWRSWPLQTDEICDFMVLADGYLLVTIRGFLLALDQDLSAWKIIDLRQVGPADHDVGRLYGSTRADRYAGEAWLVMDLTGTEPERSLVFRIPLAAVDQVERYNFGGIVWSNILRDGDQLYFNLDGLLVTYQIAQRRMLELQSIGSDYQKLTLENGAVYLASFRANLLRWHRGSGFGQLIRNDLNVMGIEGQRLLRFRCPDSSVRGERIFFPWHYQVYSVPRLADR